MTIGLYLLSGYLASSLLFFCFPNILRKKKEIKCNLFKESLQGKRVLRIAHRGGPRYTTQNTIQAFRKIVTITDMLQMDVCQTKDKILVVHHDKSLLRTCGVDKNIEDLNYNQLPKFKDQIQLDFSEGKTITSNNQKIPKLETVFQMFQGIPMNIQLKTPTDTAIKEITKLTYQYDRADITILGIRNKMQNTLKQHNTIHHFFNDSAVMKIFFAYLIGLLPFISISESSLQLPLYTDQFYNWKLQERQKTSFKFQGFFYSIKFMNFIMKPLIWHLKRRGIITMLWVCNQEKDIKRAIDTGAQGIMTDDPFLLNQILKQKKLVPL